MFTSYAPGTGKTQKMIDYAYELMRDSYVEWGIINTSFRQYIIDSKNQIKCKGIISSGKKYAVELDIDDIIKRHPDYIVIDELGYLNVTTGNKLYEDVIQLINKGIHVVSSCNMQMFYSMNIQCKKIAGIAFRYPIPDEVFDLISDIYFVDCEPRIVSERYRKGILFPEKNDLLDRYLCDESLIKYRDAVLEFLNKKNNVIYTRRG